MYENIKLIVWILSSHSQLTEESGLKYASKVPQPGGEDSFLLIIFSSWHYISQSDLPTDCFLHRVPCSTSVSNGKIHSQWRGKCVARGLSLLRKPPLYLHSAPAWITPRQHPCRGQRWVGFISMLPPWPVHCRCSVKLTFHSLEWVPEASFAESVSGDQELGWGTGWGSLYTDSWGLVQALRPLVVLPLFHPLLEEFTKVLIPGDFVHSLNKGA